MIGNDCKLLESNIDTFLNTFVEAKGDEWKSEKTLKIRQLLKLYNMFTDLARYAILHLYKMYPSMFVQI